MTHRTDSSEGPDVAVDRNTIGLKALAIRAKSFADDLAHYAATKEELERLRPSTTAELVDLIRVMDAEEIEVVLDQLTNAFRRLLNEDNDERTAMILQHVIAAKLLWMGRSGN